jgi:hypothetical protein
MNSLRIPHTRIVLRGASNQVPHCSRLHIPTVREEEMFRQALKWGGFCLKADFVCAGSLGGRLQHYNLTCKKEFCSVEIMHFYFVKKRCLLDCWMLI